MDLAASVPDLHAQWHVSSFGNVEAGVDEKLIAEGFVAEGGAALKEKSNDRYCPMRGRKKSTSLLAFAQLCRFGQGDAPAPEIVARRPQAWLVVPA